MAKKDDSQQGYFNLPNDILIYVRSSIMHGSRLWTKYDLFSGRPSRGEATTEIGFIEVERPLTIEELEKRARAIYERWARQ